MKYVLPVAFSLPAILAALCSYIFDAENLLEGYFLRKEKKMSSSHSTSYSCDESSAASTFYENETPRSLPEVDLSQSTGNISKTNQSSPLVDYEINKRSNDLYHAPSHDRSMIFHNESNGDNPSYLTRNNITWSNNVNEQSNGTELDSYRRLETANYYSHGKSKMRLNPNSKRARLKKGFYYWRNVLIRWGITKTAGLGYNIGKCDINLITVPLQHIYSY
jgi:hypothetical protein